MLTPKEGHDQIFRKWLAIPEVRNALARAPGRQDDKERKMVKAMNLTHAFALKEAAFLSALYESLGRSPEMRTKILDAFQESEAAWERDLEAMIGQDEARAILRQLRLAQSKNTSST